MFKLEKDKFLHNGYYLSYNKNLWAYIYVPNTQNHYEDLLLDALNQFRYLMILSIKENE